MLPFPVIPSPASISVSFAIAAKLFSEVILRSLLISSSLRILLSIPRGNPELAPAPNFFYPLIGLFDLLLLASLLFVGLLLLELFIGIFQFKIKIYIL